MSEITKRDEEMFIAIMAHFHKEIPIMFNNPEELTADKRADLEIEMYEELKKSGRLRFNYE
jgi:hypothetical protein